jgi:hypothetical protein
MLTFDIAIRNLIRDQYRARGLSADAIPISVASRFLSQDGVYAASLETRLPGVGLHLVRPTEETVRGLVELVSVLKGVGMVDLEAEMGAGVPRIPFPELRNLREKAIQVWRRLVGNGQVAGHEYGVEDGIEIEELIERKTEFIDVVPPQDGSSDRVLVHNDFKGEHFLVDPDSGRITGILDWADAGIGYPATDIAGLVLTVGTRLAARIAAEVGYGTEEILRGVMLARCGCVLRLDERLDGGNEFMPLDLLRDQLALSLGSCELVW